MNQKDKNKIPKECSRCLKLKPIEGHNMCSPCLRRTKRETKPSFYLGTCFSEMKRRVTHFDVLRPKYLGKKICTKEEFFNKFLNDANFLNLYKFWQENGFQRRYSPSIDRIDNEGDYTIDNLQFLVHTENTGKDTKSKIIKWIKVIDNFGNIYNSIKECAEMNGLSGGNLKKYITLGRKLNGKLYRYYET